MRWKATFFLSRSEEEEGFIKVENYGLKSLKCPPVVKELTQFENELMQIAKEVKFRKLRNSFQTRLKEDTKNIKNSEKTLIAADKTSNMYRLTKDEYNNLKSNAITSTYKKTSGKIKEEIEKCGKKFASDKGVIDRMERNGDSECFITLKDHKPNFNNRPTTRLINPSKNEVGRLSKVILDDINLKVQEALGVNQWKSTGKVLEWFKGIRSKKEYTFMVFDIKDFYPSIKESLLKEALEFAKQHTRIKKKDIELIMHARKSLLFGIGDTWRKKEGGIFDVTMGAYDGAEICELVGTYLLSLLGQKCNKENIGLYRDDGLAILKKLSGPETERMKKEFQRIFREKGLEIVIECNKKVVDYLDVTLNLNDGSYKPYRKPDDEINYIHAESDHPPNIIKQLPLSIEARLSSLSSSKRMFDEAKGSYQEALNKNGYKHILKYNPPKQNRNKRNRNRNVIWFNPPYSKTVETNIGKKFLALVDKHFPQGSKFHKIFNRSTLKVSYGCMSNIGAVINSHNKKVLGENEQLQLQRGGCNCQRGEYRGNCPLNGECQTKNVLYEATINSTLANYGEKKYKGITYNEFKTRLANHEKAFRNKEYRNETELSKEVWRIKDLGGDYNIKWKIISLHPPFNPSSKRCQLCLNEKLAILESDGPNLLNKRSEIISKCRHQARYLLKDI